MKRKKKTSHIPHHFYSDVSLNQEVGAFPVELASENPKVSSQASGVLSTYTSKPGTDFFVFYLYNEIK